MNISEAGIELIKEFEGYRAEAYQCSAGVWTIGYGSTKWADGRPVKKGDTLMAPIPTISPKDAATELLKATLEKEFVPAVRDAVKVKLTQNQFDALVSFVYNVGVGAFKSSTLLRKLNAKEDINVVAQEFDKWVFAGKKRLPGLVTRRAAEKALFLKK